MDGRGGIPGVAPEQVEQGLRAIAEASMYFSIAMLLLAVLTALLLQAFYDLWLRRSINQRAVHGWLAARRQSTFSSIEKRLGARLTSEVGASPPTTDPAAPPPSATVEEMRRRSGLEEIGIAEDSPIFELAFPTLCAQISMALQNAMEAGSGPVVTLLFADVQKRDLETAGHGEGNDLGWIDSLIDQSQGRSRELSAEQRGRERPEPPTTRGPDIGLYARPTQV